MNEDNYTEGLSKKAKRLLKIKNRLLREDDIKYQGPLSYVFLRIFAWIFLALSQIVLLSSVFGNVANWHPINENFIEFLSVISSLSTPFFIIASFGLVLSGKRKIINLIFTYGLAYLAIGFGFLIFYLRYVNTLFVEMGVNETRFALIFEGFVADRVQVNVFADLLAFVLFYFFISYQPEKVFVGQKLILFRLLMIFPIGFYIASYLIKVFAAANIINISFLVYPFLTTKSPVVFLIFVVVSLWIKYRERIFMRLGASKEEYQRFLNTNRNSLSFSITLSIIILCSIVLDIILLAVSVLYCYFNNVSIDDVANIAVNTFGVGQATSMVLAIPFILLYSYTRAHKERRIDIIIPIGGIALVLIVYVEYIYQFLLTLLK